MVEQASGPFLPISCCDVVTDLYFLINFSFSSVVYFSSLIAFVAISLKVDFAGLAVLQKNGFKFSNNNKSNLLGRFRYGCH